MTGWRQMLGGDLAAVMRIAAILHADLPEREAVFAERLALFADGCLMTDGGYAVAHPIRAGAPPPLDTLLGALPADADALHIHDVALLPVRRGAGLGRLAVAHCRAVAARRGLAWLTLIAVHGTGDYWRRHGFTAWPGGDIASYGAGAVAMRCDTSG